jgi:hypothetical protein
VKKAYAKVKAEQVTTQTAARVSFDDESADISATTTPVPSSLELHPDRQAMLQDRGTDAGQAHAEEHESRRFSGSHNASRQRRSKPSRFTKEMEVGAQRRAEIEKRRTIREAREKDRKAMSKAKRPGKDGKVKLGRQSSVLLSRIHRLTEEGKL